MRTNETSPVNSPHKKYGFIPRDHVSSQVDMSSPVSDTHDKQPLDSDHHDTPHSRQDIHHSNRDPHYSQPTYSSAHHNPGTSSPHRMSMSSSTQTLDSTTPWMPSYHDTRRGEPERQSSSPHRGTRERINATMSPQRRRNSSPHTSDRRVSASPRTHRTSFERESVPIAPKRVTTRATSPFDPNVVDRLLSTKSVGDNIPPSNPTQFPLSHSRGPEGTLEATLVRILEHQARAQEVSSTANSTALGNVSKLVTEMGKLIISAGDKKKHRRRSKSQTFASSSRSATASPTLRSQHEMLVYTPHRDVYDSTQQTQTHGPSDSTGLIEEADASRTIHVNKREESICKQNKWTGPVKANSCNKRKTKADMLDHVLSKIQAMEHQEQETSRLLVNRKNRDRHADIPVSTSSSKEVKINHKGSPLRRVVTKPPVNESLQDAIFMQKTEFDYLDRIESAISHTQDTTDVLNLPEEKGGLAVYKSPVDGENRISEPSNELQRAMKYVAADSVMRHDVKEYQLEFKRWKKLRECVFRENKTSLHDVVVRLSDALLNDLLDGATDELETLFAEIA
eukprot:CAMPEP_0185040068 /NCGR_PEP_ID=MMETSP1103-20130426/37687_1 /TAXON_ID=36769 /ORGANISM="Paraphysomonas bandaiensis, Strain Caron Lab Isolate" /LENGTH=564 /DNA_ID=CAMNT_0027579217 /DNA_START=449 /DNA_END=2139 /DNA_ORIENTATION=+